MSRYDLHRVVTAARKFIAVITRHAEQYEAPGYEKERHLACAKVATAASELHLALEGRTIFDPPTPPDDSPFRVFVGTEMDVTIQLSVIRECMRRLLRRIGYVGELVEGAAYGSMPSMKGLENLPQVGLPELPHLIRAADELEALTDTPTTARLNVAEGDEKAAAADASGTEAPLAIAIDYDALAAELAKQGKPIQAALVRYMKDKNSALVDDVARHVHSDPETSEGTISKNAARTTDSLIKLCPRLSFRVAGGMMHKEISRE